MASSEMHGSTPHLRQNPSPVAALDHALLFAVTPDRSMGKTARSTPLSPGTKSADTAQTLCSSPAARPLPSRNSHYQTVCLSNPSGLAIFLIISLSKSLSKDPAPRPPTPIFPLSHASCQSQSNGSNTAQARFYPSLVYLSCSGAQCTLGWRLIRHACPDCP